jgi:hypothetical protein
MANAAESTPYSSGNYNALIMAPPTLLIECEIARQTWASSTGPPSTTHADGLGTPMAPIVAGQSGVCAFLGAAGLATAPQEHAATWKHHANQVGQEPTCQHVRPAVSRLCSTLEPTSSDPTARTEGRTKKDVSSDIKDYCEVTWSGQCPSRHNSNTQNARPPTPARTASCATIHTHNSTVPLAIPPTPHVRHTSCTA